MSQALAKIWARRIHAGAHTIDEVLDKYGHSGVAAVKAAYYDLYGEELN
jgi:hypothetical protein